MSDMTDQPDLDPERRLLEEQVADDLDLPIDQPDAEDLPESPDLDAGDPPDAVRGPAQSLVDPVGEPADDDTLRWDPRTVRAPTREGG